MATGSTEQSRANPAAPNIPYYLSVQPDNPGAAVKLSGETPTLFTPLKIRGKTLRNRIVVAPMCQFATAAEGPAKGQLTDYHVTTLGQYALKGAALVIIEATGVQPHGRITPNCPGLWDDFQIQGVRRVADFVKAQGALCGIQLGHAGRKSSQSANWIAQSFGVRNLGADEEAGGWPEDVVGPMGGPDYVWGANEPGKAPGYYAPRALGVDEIRDIVTAFGDSARRAKEAGVDVIELHAAHGYLMHQFLSPVSNQRTDQYGGSFENRSRLLIEVIQSIRRNISEDMPFFVRLSATEWLDETEIGKRYGCWNLTDTIRLAKTLDQLGVDLVDVSSGGNHPSQKIEMFDSADYQIKMAARIRQELSLSGSKPLIGAVGLITEAEQARDIVETGDGTGQEPMADVILVGRQFLREPQWVLNVASKLGVEVGWPVQFLKGRRRL
ncbi:hypothetical protein BDW75DRAFT_247560 [Aspergillus navahoensis]